MTSTTTPRIGLTGGIGSGKSTVAAMFADLGATVIDADAISRSMTAAGGAAITSIQIQFGPDFIQDDGSMNRERMRTLIFADAVARETLESIIHPLVKLYMQDQFQAAVFQHSRLVVYDIPLLTESSQWRQDLDKILVIDCTHETQIKRVISRNGLSREAIEKIIAHQASRDERLKVADFVVFNENCTSDQLRDEVGQMAEVYGL
jgi:dephospho-CoA kinase